MAKQKVEQVIPPKKRFMDGFRDLCHARHQYPVWADLWEMFALTIMNPLTKQLYSESEELQKVWQEREDRYLSIIKKYKKDEVQTITEMFAALVEEFQIHPFQDFAGQIYMELGIGNNNAGQFFTPYSVCGLMAQVTQDHESIRQTVKDKGWYCMYDCACGGGATMIAGLEQANNEFHRLNWRNHVMVNANDIDIVCCSMCYVQLSLIGVAAIVTCSNALMQGEVNFYKEPEKVWFTPEYFSEVWVQRRFWHGYDMNMWENKYAGIRGLFRSLEEPLSKAEEADSSESDDDEWSEYDDEDWE
jgi:hypothetical protein